MLLLLKQGADMKTWNFNCRNCDLYCERPKRSYRKCPTFCSKSCLTSDRNKTVTIYLTYICETCGKKTRTNRVSKKWRFCSVKCRGCTKKFQWKNLTEEKKKEHAKIIYEKHVIKRNGCWGWKSSIDKNGYGVVPISPLAGKIERKAHRLSYCLFKGEIPENMQVQHDCDNPICTNPHHLSIGTPKKNMEDKLLRGRHNPSKGEKNGQTRLTEIEVKEIKKILKQGNLKNIQVAKAFETTPTVICLIKTGKTWKHVED
jgi:hypothetical protein